MFKQIFLKNHFLIAMPSLADPNFFQTVTYLCEHNSEGAMGIVINRPLDIRLGDILQHMDIEARDEASVDLPIFLGGPVQTDRGFVLHRPVGHWQGTLTVTERIGLTASRDVLEAIAQGAGPERSLIVLGYAGWGPGQLEQEMAANAWLSGPADTEILFELPPAKRWEAAARLLGIDIHRMSGEVGHA
jgi:putative transcriptional regulator